MIITSALVLLRQELSPVLENSLGPDQSLDKDQTSLQTKTRPGPLVVSRSVTSELENSSQSLDQEMSILLALKSFRWVVGGWVFL